MFPSSLQSLSSHTASSMSRSSSLGHIIIGKPMFSVKLSTTETYLTGVNWPATKGMEIKVPTGSCRPPRLLIFVLASFGIAMSPPVIIEDVLYQVFQHASQMAPSERVKREELTSYSLVSQDWCHAAQSILFREVFLQIRSSLLAFLRIVSHETPRGKRLASYTKFSLSNSQKCQRARIQRLCP